LPKMKIGSIFKHYIQKQPDINEVILSGGDPLRCPIVN
jgi:L-lysine 2,3-aminomutase